MAETSLALRWHKLNTRGAGGDVSSARTGHASALVGHRVFVFGGWDRKTGKTNLMHVLDLYRKKWQTLTIAESPYVRFHHNMILVNDALYIYGGNWRTDMFEFNLPLLTYQEVCQNVDGEIDKELFIRRSRRFGQSLVYYESGNGLVLFGGTLKSSHVQLFQLDSKRWTEVRTNGMSPSAREHHSALIHRNRMFVFAGSRLRRVGEAVLTSKKRLNDIVVLTFQSRRFATWSTLSEEQQGIIGREKSSMVYFNGTLIIYGGVSSKASWVRENTEIRTLSNTWHFDLAKNFLRTEHQLKLGGALKPVSGHSTVMLHFSKRILIIGGENTNSTERLHDVGCLQFI